MAENIANTKTGTPSQQNGQLAVGKIVYPATAITATDYTEVDCGFKPKKVEFVNVTDQIRVEFWEGMTANNCVKTAANGAVTLETTNGGITLTDTGFRVTQNATLAVIAASKTCVWKAEA